MNAVQPNALLHIASRSNALIKTLCKLSQNNTAYRKTGLVWLEGEHLCAAAKAQGWLPDMAVFSESFWPQAQEKNQLLATKNIVLPDALFKYVSGLESPASMGFVQPIPSMPTLAPHSPTVILDRVQDAGNVGSILRSAAAFGFTQVLAMKGTAALWSSKVLRAGMGAHFGLQLVEGLELQDLADLKLPLLTTSSHQGSLLYQQTLPMPCAWVMGHEGQGVCAELMERASLWLRIAQPGGQESLNVAAAAAICLHASALRSI